MKALPQGSYLIRPFKTYKGHSYNYTYSGGSNPSVISVDDALIPPADWLWNEYENLINDDGLHKYNLYTSIQQLYYYDSSSIRRLPQWNRDWDVINSHGDGVYVLSVSQYSYGERVRPSSISITTTASTGSIVDDGSGRLYCETDPTTYIGNVFYSQGIAVIGKMNVSSSLTGSVVTQEGMYLKASDQLTIQYESQLTLYEHIALCTIEKGELNYSSNPSLTLFTSSSVSGSSKLIDAILSGSLNPYMTTIGLYNSAGELLMVGKVPRPIKRAPDIAQTFVLRLDI